MRSRLVAALLVVVAGACEEEPSRLDDLAAPASEETAKLRTLEALDAWSAPLGSRLDLLRWLANRQTL